MGDLKKHYKTGKLVIMLNSLGNVTALEMTLLGNEVLKWCEQAGDTVVRLISGEVVSSLDMNGISLTVLNVSELGDEVLSFVDLPVSSPFWPKVCNIEAHKFAPIEQKIVSQKVQQDCTDKDGDKAKWLRASIAAVMEKVIAAEPALTKMDGDVGDADLGIGATRAAKNVLENLKFLNLQEDLKGATFELADLRSDGFGGSSGPLWGSFIAAAAGKLPTKINEAEWNEWTEAYVAGTLAMMEVGGAKKGNRTMIDALLGGHDWLTQANGIPTVAKLASFVR